MEKERSYKAHFVVLPFHGKGHINPMVQFAKRLVSKGIKITVATSLSNAKTMGTKAGSITFESIYDDCTEGGLGGPGGFKGYLDRFEASGSRGLTELMRKLDMSKYPIKCLVYDANILWALDIAKELGIAGAAFFTQSCAAIASYYPMFCDLSGEPLQVPAFSMPGLPEIRIPNLPSLGTTTGRYSPIMLFILNQFNNIERADWVLFNSFDKLEVEVVKWMKTLWPVKTIGPTIPYVYLDNQVENNDYGLNLYKPSTDICIKWLNTKETGSIVYVSFGSAASVSVEQMTEMAKALKQGGNNFLWMVKPTEVNKLPSNFEEEMTEKGLVVTWCPQLEVLSHRAIRCFITHCGWNSTIEAISFGVPMIAIPLFLDQMINAHFVEKVWEVGVKAEGDENGLTCSEEIVRCIDEVMCLERKELIKKNTIMWKEVAKEVASESGSSTKYIDEIIESLVVNKF